MGNPASKTPYPQLAGPPVGKKIDGIYWSRLSQFTSQGQYKKNNLLGKQVEDEESGGDAVKLSAYAAPELSRPAFKDVISKSFGPAKVGDSFGPSWATHWFRIRIQVPARLKTARLLVFHWDAGNEGMIWTEDGTAVHGLTGNGERIEWVLPDRFRDGKERMFYIEMACNTMFGNPGSGGQIQPPDPDRRFVLERAAIVAINPVARALMFDYSAIYQTGAEYGSESLEYRRAVDVCSRIMDTFDATAGSEDGLKACRKIAAEFVGLDVDSADVYADGTDRLKNRTDIVTAVGHCHIDCCWLWPWAETRRKVARSWASQCDLMDRYPELRFTCSQAQQYHWLETDYPELFERVRSKVRDGTFQPVGGSWVEHDTNMPSGESLVRQFLFGQRYFQSRFGIRSTTFWLPDTFGYSAQLPQLCRLAGMSRFFTQKLGWNNINKFPHTTFHWVGLDGSQVLSHMPPSETYTAEARLAEIRQCITQHKTLDQDASSLLVYGHGDGGGGPTVGHLERLRRYRGIVNAGSVGSLPRVEAGASVDHFFTRLERRAVDDGVKFPTWQGELYFEFHRGTYTTQAANKRKNRRVEAMLHELEFLATMATVRQLTAKAGTSEGADHGGAGYVYPKAKLDEMWQDVLLCQFHDCLPGSSIEMCYGDSDKVYSRVFRTGAELLKQALDQIGLDESPPADKTVTEVGLNVYGWTRAERIAGGNDVVVFRPGLTALSDRHALVGTHGRTDECVVTEESTDVFVLSNGRFTVKVADGVIVSIVDASHGDRQVISAGEKANQFVLFDDKPLYWQAWDVEMYHLTQRTELKATKTRIVEQTADAVAVQTHVVISSVSSLTTTVRLVRQKLTKTGISRDGQADDSQVPIEIETDVDWHERMKFLKVEFPVDIQATEASYETQFGLIRRPTHYNTSWDMAKFEVCCHRWADLSEHGYGVSVVNDSKYGFATAGKTMRLSLLRASKAPDGHADMGVHRIRYAVMPHSGPVDYRVVRAGIEFNRPVRRCFTTPDRLVDISRLLSSIRLGPVSGGRSKSVVLDTVKRAEDDDFGQVRTEGKKPDKTVNLVIRLYESVGGRAIVNLVWDRSEVPVKTAVITNLLEDRGPAETALELVDQTAVKLTFRPFEVVTVRLTL